MSMIEDLSKRVEEEVAKLTDPLEQIRQEILEAKNELSREERDLDAQLARVNATLDATKLRKKAGRKPGTQRQPQQAAA